MPKHLSTAGNLLLAASLGGLALVASGLADQALGDGARVVNRHLGAATAAIPWGPVGAGLGAPPPRADVSEVHPATNPGATPAAAGDVSPAQGIRGQDTGGATPAPAAPAAPVAPNPVPFRPITRIVIPRLPLTADVVPARLIERDNGVTWEVPAFKVGHAELTAGAGAPGNAVLVGHVTSQDAGNVFRSLDRVAAGDAIQVFAGEQAFEYRVAEVRSVARTEVSVLAPTDTASISLITCTGTWLPAIGDFAQRLVVRAELIPTEAAVVPPPGTPPPAFPPDFRTIYDERPGQTAGGRIWPNDPAGAAWSAGDGYHMFARRPGRFVALGVPAEAPPGDVAVTAAFRKAGGPPGGGYGLILRDQGPGPRDGVSQEGRYYVLEAGDLGQVGVWRRDGDRWIDLLPWTRSEAVRPGGASNELTVQAVGRRITFLVNGSVVASLTDPILSGGAVGVFVGGDLNEVALDRLVIQVPR